MGAEDWSYVLQQVPGSMAFLGTRPAGIAPAEVAPNHSNRMVIDEGAMATGIALYSGVALRWLDESPTPARSAALPPYPPNRRPTPAESREERKAAAHRTEPQTITRN